MKDEREKYNERADLVRNGFVVIRGLCEQIRRGRLTQEAGLDKIEHRAREIEAALGRLTPPQAAGNKKEG